MRFFVEVVEDVRSKVGPDYPVSVRIGGYDIESSQPCPTYDEPVKVAQSLEKAGANVLHVSGGGRYLENSEVDSELLIPLATNVWAAEIVKKNIGLPVITCGSITTPN
jgi:2,4-dienoyl-CoA reductase-like NADH-dependent reductase (Old Yellow Enzyme family)